MEYGALYLVLHVAFFISCADGHTELAFSIMHVCSCTPVTYMYTVLYMCFVFV